jgi:hypothetical protein
MGERRARFRVFLQDARGDGQYLRATWHPNGRLFVLSHWQDDVCVAATRIGMADAGELMALLAAGLTDAATTSPTPRSVPRPAPPVRRGRRSLVAWLRSRSPFGAPATSPAPPGQEAEPFESTVIPWAVPGDRPQAVSGAGGGPVGR